MKILCNGFDKKEIVFQIKKSLNIQEVLNRYGYQKNRSGFLCCPFHSEKTASLKIYDSSNSYYCFGCGVGGDVISFVMHLFRLDFSAAVLRIDEDFRLGLFAHPRSYSPQETRDHLEKWKREAEQEVFLQKIYQMIYSALSNEFRRMWWGYQKQKPNSPDSPLNPEFITILHRIDYVEYWLETYNTFEKWKEAYG